MTDATGGAARVRYFVDPITRGVRSTPPPDSGITSDSWEQLRATFAAEWETFTDEQRIGYINAAFSMPCITIQPGGENGAAEVPKPYHVIIPSGNIGRQDYWSRRNGPTGLVGFCRKATAGPVALMLDEFLAAPERAVGMFAVLIFGGEFVTVKPAITSVQRGTCTP